MPGSSGQTGKVLLIGLDGLDPEFLERHLAELPVLRDLVEKGASGRLRSTIPPFSLTAWTSAMSGMNPARTGVTCLPADDFSDSIPPLNSRTVKVPRLWDVAGQMGRKVGVVNVPLTYPPDPVNGFMISCFLTPAGETKFTYPDSLRGEIDPDYRPAFDFRQDTVAPDFFLEQLYRLTANQFESVEYLVRNKPWDLFLYVLSGTDWIQHYFVKDPGLPGAGEAEKIMVDYFQYADAFLGRLIAAVDRSTTIVILSDHGFGKVPSRYVYLNSWLEREGYLSFKRSGSKTLKNFLAAHVRTLGKSRVLSLLKPRIPARLRTGYHDFTRLRKEWIDWNQTRAHFYLFMHHTGYIRINRERCGLQERERLRGEIIADLNRLDRSRPGGRIFSRICAREEIFRGGDLSSLPDIFLLFAPEWLGQAGDYGEIFQEIPLGGRPNATHRMEGVFILAGPDVLPGLRLNLEITDIAPTVCRLLSLPIPEGTDGRVARECFSPGSLPAAAGTDFRRYERPGGGETEWKREEQEDALGKLRALGYL